ncbi:MAG TPA: SAM-dependent methyltransferase, partial [Pseudogracilibacillus sp.]|nr:SAM-dependent methyltransferase [Pseudogracilibacillus sp.]
NGVIVCDNVLFKGYVVQGAPMELKRLQQLVDKIRAFNDWVVHHESFHTSIIPVGDGLTISIKK